MEKDTQNDTDKNTQSEQWVIRVLSDECELVSVWGNSVSFMPH